MDGLIRLAAGSTASARTSLEAAVTGWDAIGRIWESSWARLDLAACLIRGNRHIEAIPVLDGRRATAERLDSPPLRERVEELASTARSRGITDEPWRPLTAREFEVARYVAEGHDKRADRRGAGPLSEDGQRAHRAHPGEAGRDPPHRDRSVGHVRGRGRAAEPSPHL